MNSRIVLSPWVNGVGDNLAISSLPERFVREYGAQVYIKRNVRNDDMARLIWETNPFISGMTEENANVSTPSDEMQRIGCVTHGSLVAAIEASIGFPPPYNTTPRIYWQPIYDRGLSEYSLIDAASVTCKISKEAFYPYVDYLIERQIIRPDKCLFLNCGIVDHVNDFYPEMQRINPKNIFETASMIYSAKNFITVQSGLASIASALKGSNPYPKVHALIAQAIYNNKVWVLPNINYYITGKLKEDFEFV